MFEKTVVSKVVYLYRYCQLLTGILGPLRGLVRAMANSVMPYLSSSTWPEKIFDRRIYILYMFKDEVKDGSCNCDRVHYNHNSGNLIVLYLYSVTSSV